MLSAVKFEKMEDRKELANLLMNDSADTLYNKKEDLETRILTDEKISGFLVKFSTDEGNTFFPAGLVLYKAESNTITDMFTFTQGRGNFLFRRITEYFLSAMGWGHIALAIDDNNHKMKKYFEDAVNNPGVYA